MGKKKGKKESTGAPLEQQSSGGQRTATQPQGGSQPTPQSGPARQQGGKGRGKGRGDSQSQSSQKHVNVPSGPGVSDQSQFPTQTSQPGQSGQRQPAWGQPQPTIQPPSAWSPPQQVLGQLPQNVNQPPPAKGQQPQQPQYPYQQAQQAGGQHGQQVFHPQQQTQLGSHPPGIPQIRQPQQQQPAGETPVSKQQPQKGPEVGGGGDQPSSHTPGSLQRESPRQLSQQGDQTKSITPTQQPQKGQQKGKGKQKGQPQGGGGGDQTASTSQISSTSTELSKIKISDKSQGGTDILPMKYIRAKPGTKGRKIPIEVNHLALNLGKLKTAIHYDVNLIPDIPKKYLRDVLERFRQIHYNNRYPAFDGRKNLYSSSPLPFGDYIEDEIVIREPDGREKKFKVEIKFANKVDLTPLQNLLVSEVTPREALQVVDIVLRSAPAASCISAGRSFFVKPPVILDLGEGMEMYNGIYQSAIRGWKPLLNVDVAHKAFPKSSPLIDILPELFGDYFNPFTRENLNQPLDRGNNEILNTFIKTLRISYEIPGHPQTRRTYRANGIDSAPREKTFKLDNGQSMTVEKYFLQQKNFRLRYSHLPTIWVGSTTNEKRILLPLELCSLVEGQVTNRKMTEGQTSKMIKFTATNTQIRKQKIMDALHRANYNSNNSVREFGFSVANEFEKLEARVLQPPSLEYADKKVVRPSRGVWRGEKFFKPIVINKWTIISVDRRPPRPDDLTRFASEISKNAGFCGMSITAPPDKPFQTIRCLNVNDIKKYFETQKDKRYDVIFVVVPNSGQQYSYVKTAAEINVGCLTQCIKVKTLNKMNQQTAVNILLKVNSKLNGTNHFLCTRPPIMNRPCMIMGADVTHPSPDARGIPSVAAVTASHDPKAFQYNICWRLQPPKVEIIEDLEAITIEQLKYFYNKTKVKPERIIFFRDGVSEGQFDQVRTSEIRAIRSACKRLQADGYEPSITFLVVQKRHHTRLFPLNPRDSEDKNSNVPAGTCVDTNITHPFMQDFYLVSHASIQGVAKPTKYCTLWDDNNMSNDDIEELAYFLCHMFTRCTRSVSYPAPTYYAHLAAARAKVYIENERLDMDQLPREFLRFQIQDVIRKDLPMFFV